MFIEKTREKLKLNLPTDFVKIAQVELKLEISPEIDIGFCFFLF